VRKKVLDTNIITRYLIGDVESHLIEAKKIFKQAEDGEVTLLILPVVVAEVSYVLQKFYHKSELEISNAMQTILIQPWLELEHKRALLGMWGWYEQGQHFVDSYLLALDKFEGIEIVSFDKRLNKLKQG
jgi:predicted nucleic acid-binding protein